MYKLVRCRQCKKKRDMDKNKKNDYCVSWRTYYITDFHNEDVYFCQNSLVMSQSN